MPTINDLSSVSEISDSDQIPLFVAGSQTTRRGTVGQLRERIEDGMTVSGGILALSSVYQMRGTSASAVALTTTPAPFNATQYSSPSVALPAGNAAFQADPTNGRFIALRDCSLVQFWAEVQGTWPTNRDLILKVLIGDQTTPFEADFAFRAAGAGGSNMRTAALAGIGTNLNDSLNLIRAGQTIRLVASMDVADTLNLTRIAFAVQSLDGL